MKPRSRRELRRYQVVFCNKIKRIPHLILALPMGSGKSGTTLTALVDLLDDREISRVLIVAPKLVATVTWPDEIEAWEHTRDLEWTLLRAEDDDEDIIAAREDAYRTARDLIGLPVKDATKFTQRRTTIAKNWKRSRLANSKTEIHIINKEGLQWLWEFFDKGNSWPYDMIVVDEASMFKNARMRTNPTPSKNPDAPVPKKQISRFGVIAKARKFTRRTVQLSGTIAPKGLINLWGPAYIADLGQRLGTSKEMYKRRWFDTGYMGWNADPLPGAREDIMGRLSDIMFSMREEDCVDLPPTVHVPVKVRLPKKVLAEYRNLEKTLVSEVYDVEAVNRGVLHGKLLQFANGSMYREDGKDVWIHDEKLEALENLVDELNGEPLLIAYSFKFDIARIRKRFPKLVVFGEGDARKTAAKWNAGNIPLMAAHPNSIGHGQNIQFGGHHSCWYGLTPDLEFWLQFNKRLNRPGQTEKVFNHIIIAEQTYDERILPLLNGRDAEQQAITDSVRVQLLRS